jgi:hypothetical protein
MSKMATHREDTLQWKCCAEKGMSPYGVRHVGAGLMLISLVRDDNHEVRDTLEGAGRACWRLVNLTIRKRTFPLQAVPLDGRIQWKESERGIEGDLLKRTLIIDRFHPDDIIYPDRDTSADFLVLSAGEETLRTMCPGSGDGINSRFRTICLKNEGTQMKRKPRDWFGALAKAAEGLPGGRVLISPLMKLRDDERAAERNARIDVLLEENVTLSQETLRRTSTIEGDTAEIRKVLDLISPMLTTLVVNVRNGSTHNIVELPTSAFPLPIRRGLLIEELLALFEHDVTDLRACLRVADVRVEDPHPQEYITRFIDSLPGRDADQLGEVFSCLSTKRPASLILKFAADFLGANRTK